MNSAPAERVQPASHPCCRGGGGQVLTGRERMLAALKQTRVDRPPVWFMRQAGRHLPGYRAIRERVSFLELCRNAEVNREVSAEPAHRYGLDAAIVFNDILIPLIDMGMRLDFAPGPRFERLVTSAAEAAALSTPRYADQTPVFRCLRALREEVGAGTAVLGFIGAPFTVAAFAVAGSGPQRTVPLDTDARERADVYEAMQERLVPVLTDYALAQIRAGADAIQIFESLALELDAAVYEKVGLPFLERIIGEIRRAVPGMPVIVFGRGIWKFIPHLGAAGATAISLDATRPLGEAREMLRARGLSTGLQGNLPSELLLEPPDRARAEAQALLSQWRSIVPLPALAQELGPTGWVFNLGHGVPQDASPETVQAVVDAVQSFSCSCSNAEAKS